MVRAENVVLRFLRPSTASVTALFLLLAPGRTALKLLPTLHLAYAA